MRNVFILMLSFLLSGCVTIVSDQIRPLIDQSIGFSDLKANPDNYLGKYLLLGGKIIASSSSSDISRMEIMQVTIDKDGVPTDLDSSSGRFIAESPSFYDSAIYQPNSLVTIVGEVKGKREQSLDGAPYLYPVVSIKEIYLWDPDKFSRRPTRPENPYVNSYDQPLPDRPLTPLINQR
jgi:outer membrane lipoprotein